jgi:hypothetical protein
MRERPAQARLAQFLKRNPQIVTRLLGVFVHLLDRAPLEPNELGGLSIDQVMSSCEGEIDEPIEIKGTNLEAAAELTQELLNDLNNLQGDPE